MNNITTINDLRNVGFEIGAVERFEQVPVTMYRTEEFVEVPANLTVDMGGDDYTLDGVLTFRVASRTVAEVSVRTLLSLALGQDVRTAPRHAAPEDVEQAEAEAVAEAWANSEPAPDTDAMPVPGGWLSVGFDATQE